MQVYIVLHFWSDDGRPSVHYFQSDRELFDFTHEEVAKVCEIDYQPENGEELQISTIDEIPTLGKGE